MEPYKVSIATGCYNSEHFIRRTFQSLVSQNYENLEWNVVVDGLTDRTLELVESFRGLVSFPINITVFEKNRGGTISVLTAVRASTGDFTMILDHDDELLPNALHDMLRVWDKITQTKDGDTLAGIFGRCVNERDEFLGRRLEPEMVCTLSYFQHVKKCRGECACLLRTAVFREYYHFNSDEIGCTNGLIWNRIDQKFQSIFTDLVVRRYHTEVTASLSNDRRIRTPGPLAHQELESLNDNSKYFSSDPVAFAKQIVQYLRYGYHAKRGIVAPAKALRDPRMQVAAACLWPVAVWRARQDKRLGRI